MEAPSPILLQQLINRIEERPSQIAMVSGETSTDYQTLGRCISAFTRYFDARINAGDKVALCMENSPIYVAALYGIWSAGGAAVTLNTALKGREIKNLLAHSQSKWLVIEHHHRELDTILDDITCEALIIRDTQTLDNAIDHLHGNTPLQADNDDFFWQRRQKKLPTHNQAAQIIYTSGTTGQPKGVVLSHGNLAANTRSICQTLPIKPDDRMCCVLPFFYSYGNSVLHSHLVIGASLILENSMLYPHKVLQSLADKRATAFAGVPSTYLLLLARTRIDEFDLSDIRYCTQAGGAMESEKIRQWQRCLPTAEFFVMYGQTEATARLTCLLPDHFHKKAGSVGKPIPGVNLSVRDEKGHALPPGSLGEICAQGENIMTGYWRDPAETRACLRNGWLHTGDLGYCDDDGFFFLVGRNKEMIKTGAHRVSPREIEAVIATVPGVYEVAVVGIPDEILGQVIKACIIANTQIPMAQHAELRRQILRVCQEQLPLYKIPKTVDFFRTFPRTCSGKIQKHLLVTHKDEPHDQEC